VKRSGFLEFCNKLGASDNLIKRTTADVGLVFSDMRMPGPMDGVALAQLVRSQYPAVKVVLSSGQLSVDWAEHDGFFRKPYDLARVTKHIKSLIG
jgi:two-component system, response regulator PdtaR